ncbi:MAG: hypothetical protein PWQ88_565 [Candidatus Methanomethylophilaceae archaeon]|nr:hypothetical protein [Candidatus Methanomethylophilaceae archaeon]
MSDYELKLSHTAAGIPVAVERIPGAQVSGFLLAVRTGSRDEPPSLMGVSHLLEHVVFRGTKNRDNVSIMQEIEAAGGQLNAFTSQEVTAYYGITLDRTAQVAKDLLADITVNPLIREEDIEMEKRIVLQEISMWKNNPDSYIHSLFAKTLWDGHGLGQNEAGEEETVMALSEKDLRGYFEDRYRIPELTVIACGNVEINDVISWAEESYDHRNGSIGIRREPPKEHGTGLTIFPRDGDHCYVAMGFPAYSAQHPHRHALQVLNTILGGGGSSRLFQSVREERGLVYSIYSMLEQYSDAGSMAAFFSSTEDNVVEAVETVADEMARLLREGISEWELEKAKNIIRGSMIRNMESTTSRMYRLARSYVLRGEAVPFQADLDRLDAVGEEDVMSVAEDIIRHDRLNVVVYGKDSGKLGSLDIGSLEF